MKKCGVSYKLVSYITLTVLKVHRRVSRQGNRMMSEARDILLHNQGKGTNVRMWGVTKR